jgi:hypothetical protein
MAADPSADLRAAVQKHERRIRSLDNEDAVALDLSGEVLVAKRGDGPSVRFTDAEAERMRGARVFTHNHPGGRSFSPEDVALACTLDFGEMRVVTVLWTHVIRPGPEGWNGETWTSRLDDAVALAGLEVQDELLRKVERRRLPIDEANADFWHHVWERVAEREGLDYERFTGERTDAD